MGLLDNLFAGQTNDPADEQWKRAALEELLARGMIAPGSVSNDPAENARHGSVGFVPSRSRGDIPRPMLIDEPVAPPPMASGAPVAPELPAPMPMAPPAGSGPMDDAASPWKPAAPPMTERTVTERPVASTPYAPPPPTPSAGGASSVPGAGGISSGTAERKPRETNMWDRMSALSRGYNTGGLVGGIADAANLDNIKDDARAEQNATIRALSSKIGDPDLARMISRDPDLMKTVIGNVFAPKGGDWAPTEYTDPATGRTTAVLYNKKDGSRIPLGEGKKTDLPADLVTKVGQLRTSIAALKRARPVFDREFGASDVAQLAAASSPGGDIAAVSGEIGRARRDMMQSAEGAIRIASGAAVPEQEMGRYIQMYIPTVTDTVASRKQKMDNLSTFLDELATAVNTKARVLTKEEVAEIHARTTARASGSGPSASSAPSAGGAAPTRLRFDPSTGTIGSS